MPGFRMEVQGDVTGIELTILYKSDSPLAQARQELAKVYAAANEELIKRLMPKDDVEQKLEAFRSSLEGK